ncbi:MAG: thioredoxin family protein [Candidatus Marsarchaeota archaeon]|jgi:glutaredoxin-like protein|nr:thioredoxin family protein [Candidatus Marsarchaeota archaeon]MCL5419240.1 thioredoxin family protein [Candidatus Marsarchaeota archaeon]
MGLMKEEDKKYVKDLFEKNLANEVNMLLFVDSKEKCMYCNETKELMEELASMNPKLKLKVYDINANKKEAQLLGIDKTPSLTLWGKTNYSIYYFGIPAGHEFAALLEDIVDVSKGATRLQQSTKEKLKSISKPMSIKVFVTPTCPYCPRAVRTAHQFAMENKNIRAEMIEAMEFEAMSNKYEVMAVPKIVINDTVSFEGALPEDAFMEYMLEAAK